MVLVFVRAAIRAKPDKGKIGEFGFWIDFAPSIIIGLFKAIDFFACIIMDAMDVYEWEAKRGGTACGPQNASKPL